MKRRILLALIVLGFVYTGSYLLFRQSHIERWDRDQKEYVIFPADNRVLYYIYRPLTLVDGPVTGMRFHIGPHR